MSIYGSGLQKERVINNNTVTFTNEEASLLQLSALRGYMMLDEADDMLETLEEGANIDYTKAFTSAKKEIKTGIKDVKSLIKAKEYTKAKSKCKELHKVTSDLIKKIDSIDSSVGSAVLGYIAQSYLTLGEVLLPVGIIMTGTGLNYAGVISSIHNGSSLTNIIKIFGGAGISTVGYVWALIKEIIIFIKDIITLINEIKDKGANANTLNLFRNKLIRYAKDYDKIITKLEDTIEKKSKEDK